MAEKHILHMLSPLRHVSPFDVNMAIDASFDAVLPYANVAPDEVTGLVQDAIFSRPPKAGVRTGVFFGGRDAIATLDMMEAAKRAMVPPFVISLFADPAGSFTTAAAMVAKVEKLLKDKRNRALARQKLVIFGATGVVGFASGVIAALEGAEVTLAGHDGRTRVDKAAEEIHQRFRVRVQAADASSDSLKAGLLSQADVVLCAGKAGVRILSATMLKTASNLQVVADVNAVPPLGVEAIDVTMDGAEIPGGALGIGALAIGQIKYRAEFGLFRRMIEAEKPVTLDFRDAFKLARELVG
jgi:methylene-tetrahydromethanopterin dehydrogenase